MKSVLLSLLAILFVLSSVQTTSAVTREEAENRLPPVVTSISFPDNLVPGQTYNISWTIMGYPDEGLDSECVIYFPTGRIDVNDSDLDTSVQDGRYHWGIIQSYQFDFSGSFTVPSSESNGDVVIRFFSRPHGSIEEYKQVYLSAIIPGSVDPRPYETEGRKIVRTVGFSNSGLSSSFSYNSFFRVVSSNINLVDSNFSLIEVKNPEGLYSVIYYSKIRIIPTEDAVITRMIPVKVEPRLNTGFDLTIKLLRIVGSVVTNATPIKVVDTGLSIVELLDDLRNFYNEERNRASIEFDLSGVPEGALYFLVETDRTCSFDVAATWAINSTETLSTTHSLGYPYNGPF